MPHQDAHLVVLRHLEQAIGLGETGGEGFFHEEM